MEAEAFAEQAIFLQYLDLRSSLNFGCCARR